MNKLQLTLALLKPDIAHNDIALKEITKIILENKFYIVKTKWTKLSLNDAKKFYEIHKDKFFYNRLTYSMSSGSIRCHVLAKENAIVDWRKLMGATKVFKTIYDDPNSIRGQYGTTDTRNATHGSDSIENAISEMKFFFPEFNAEQWYEIYEKYYRENLVKFNEKSLEHEIITNNK